MLLTPFGRFAVRLGAPGFCTLGGCTSCDKDALLLVSLTLPPGVDALKALGTFSRALKPLWP